jgi:type 1 glutamine amidotransferase
MLRIFTLIKKASLFLFPALLVISFVGCSESSNSYQGKKALFLIGEHEYGTPESLPAFAEKQLTPLGIESSFIFAESDDRASIDCHTFNGLGAALESADILVISLRRRYPETEDLTRIRAWIDSGKPVIAVRTASHAFGERDKGAGYQAPVGHASWNTFDVDVLGASYQGHYKAEEENPPLHVDTWIETSASNHPIVKALTFKDPFKIDDKLYEYINLDPAIEVVLSARYEDGEPKHPIAWTNEKEGKRIFYMSPAGPEEMALPQIQSLLKAAVLWGLDG